MEKLTEKNLRKEIEKAKARLAKLEGFVKCDDCGKYVHTTDLGQDEAWASLCKDCVI